MLQPLNQIKNLDRQFTTDWMTKHVSDWLTLLAPFVGKPDLRFLEVGAFEGRSACWWLEQVLTHPSCQLHLIDWWSNAPEIEARCKANLFEFTESNRAFIHKGYSRQVLPQFKTSSFDFIYLDGSHEAADVLLDGLLALPLLKIGGILLFDDYEWKKSEVRYHPPKPGIDAFLSLCDWQLEVLHQGYQVAVKKTAPAVLSFE